MGNFSKSSFLSFLPVSDWQEDFSSSTSDWNLLLSGEYGIWKHTTTKKNIIVISTIIGIFFPLFIGFAFIVESSHISLLSYHIPSLSPAIPYWQVNIFANFWIFSITSASFSRSWSHKQISTEIGGSAGKCPSFIFSVCWPLHSSSQSLIYRFWIFDPITSPASIPRDMPLPRLPIIPFIRKVNYYSLLL